MKNYCIVFIKKTWARQVLAKYVETWPLPEKGKTEHKCERQDTLGTRYMYNMMMSMETILIIINFAKHQFSYACFRFSSF
jgi:hypothetical protein